MDHHGIYIGHIDQPYGDRYAAAVGRFQEGFLRDKVCRDLDRAFEKAVETCEKLVPAIKAAA
jgi:hypothetical protein